MKKHFKYLSYILRHKWFVFQECVKLGIPFLGLIHDWQKFLPFEWMPYVETFYGPWKYDERPAWLVESFDRAWLHHQHLGPHHWQHWISRNDSGSTIVLEMPDKYRKEMLADWRGASKAKFGIDNTPDWYKENKDKIILGPQTRTWIESQIFVRQLYANSVTEWFVARCLEEAKELARETQLRCGFSKEELDLDLEPVPDNTPLTMTLDSNRNSKVTKTAKEWAESSPVGLLMSTEF